MKIAVIYPSPSVLLPLVAVLQELGIQQAVRFAPAGVFQSVPENTWLFIVCVNTATVRDVLPVWQEKWTHIPLILIADEDISPLCPADEKLAILATDQINGALRAKIEELTKGN